jgi:hypothetical protein
VAGTELIARKKGTAEALPLSHVVNTLLLSIYTMPDARKLG